MLLSCSWKIPPLLGMEGLLSSVGDGMDGLLSLSFCRKVEEILSSLAWKFTRLSFARGDVGSGGLKVVYKTHLQSVTMIVLRFCTWY